MEKIDTEKLLEEYKCFKCGHTKPRMMFHENNVKGKSRPVSIRCKECRKLYKTKEKPRCTECKYFSKLNDNGLCRDCNTKLGLRQCKQCNSILFLQVDFESISKKQYKMICKDCTGYWNRQSTKIL